MAKIIINNRSSRSDIDALRFVAAVITMGRVNDSNKSYWHLTVFGNEDKCAVSAECNKKSDTFVVTDYIEKEKEMEKDKRINATPGNIELIKSAYKNAVKKEKKNLLLF